MSREVELLERLLSRSSGPQGAPILNRLAVAHGELGQREEEIRTWARLVRDHPDYASMDEVLFRLGAALSAIERHEPARRVFHRLVQSFPSSGYVPAAMMAFAEHYRGNPSTANRFRQRALQELADLLRASPADPRACEWVALGELAATCLGDARTP